MWILKLFWNCNKLCLKFMPIWTTTRICNNDYSFRRRTMNTINLQSKVLIAWWFSVLFIVSCRAFFRMKYDAFKSNAVNFTSKFYTSKLHTCNNLAPIKVALMIRQLWLSGLNLCLDLTLIFSINTLVESFHTNRNRRSLCSI